MRPLAAVLTLSGLGCLSACALLVDTDGLTGASAQSGGGDAARAPEASAPSDGGLDGAADARPSSSSPCAIAHVFCDDFDTGSEDLTTRWDKLETFAGTLALDSTRSRSAPRSLRMNVTPTTGEKHSSLTKSIPTTANAARVELDLFVPSPNGSFAEIDPVGLELAPPPSGVQLQGLYVVIHPDGTYLQFLALGQPSKGAYLAPIALERDAWHHLVMTYSYATSPPSATLSVDGRVANVTMLQAAAPSVIRLQLGAPYANDANLTWAIDFDNATVDIP